MKQISFHDRASGGPKLFLLRMGRQYFKALAEGKNRWLKQVYVGDGGNFEL
jgi:hypothetical protein